MIFTKIKQTSILLCSIHFEPELTTTKILYKEVKKSLTINLHNAYRYKNYLNQLYNPIDLIIIDFIFQYWHPTILLLTP